MSNEKNELIIHMPAAVHRLWNAQQELARHYSDTGLRFTLDGRLVGDIGEALALERFDLVRPKKRTPGVDAVTRTGRTVQVKATGNDQSGPAFTPGKGCADDLLFFRLNFLDNTAIVTYNGPEAPIRELLPKGEWNGTVVVALADVQRLAAEVEIPERIPLKSGRDGFVP